jgi:hypothetical protein
LNLPIENHSTEPLRIQIGPLIAVDKTKYIHSLPAKYVDAQQSMLISITSPQRAAQRYAKNDKTECNAAIQEIRSSTRNWISNLPNVGEGLAKEDVQPMQG